MSTKTVTSIEKTKAYDLNLLDDVITDIDIKKVNKIYIPFVSFDIQEDRDIEIQNFTDNNLVVRYIPTYGVPKPEKYTVRIKIPFHADVEKEFNEFYVDMTILDEMKISPRFYVVNDSGTTIYIESTPSTIDKSTTFHFFEDNAGNYTVNWKVHDDETVI